MVKNYININLHLFIRVYLYYYHNVCMHMYLCMHVCKYACMHMYVCMHACICMYAYDTCIIYTSGAPRVQNPCRLLSTPRVCARDNARKARQVHGGHGERGRDEALGLQEFSNVSVQVYLEH